MHLPLNSHLLKNSSPGLIISLVCLGIFVSALDQNVVYGCLPGMMVDINLPITRIDQAAWIVVGYLLGYTFAMPLMGRVSDVHGHGRIYIISMGIFAAGSILVALSSSLEWMVAARVIQAVGGGAVVPIAMAIAGDLYAGKGRAVAVGVIGAAIEAGGALGPFYGAIIDQYWGWKWIFWINVPVSLIIIAVVFLFFKPAARVRERIDYLGGILLAGGLAFLSLALSQQTGQSGYAVWVTVFSIAAVALFAGFFLRINRVPDPLIKLSMFKNRVFSAANLTNLLVGAALIIAMVNIPLMSDTIMEKSPVEGGLRLLRLTVMLSLGAVAGGFMTKRFGYRFPTFLGLVLSAVGFFFMSRWSLEVAEPQLTIHLAVCGLGFGLVIAPLGTAVMDSVREDQKGLASSMVIMMRMMGMIVGLSAITSWGMDRFHLMTADLSLTEIMSAPETLTDSLLALFHNFFLASAIICLAAILPAMWLITKRKNR
ncbi:MAG: MFS transporter [Dehalococcoidales bacterium]|nr:MFS transporter [Dehalococcoidales bacterium]